MKCTECKFYLCERKVQKSIVRPYRNEHFCMESGEKVKLRKSHVDIDCYCDRGYPVNKDDYTESILQQVIKSCQDIRLKIGGMSGILGVTLHSVEGGHYMFSIEVTREVFERLWKKEEAGHYEEGYQYEEFTIDWVRFYTKLEDKKE